MDGAYADRERAVAILSGLTIYLENHAAILKSEVLPALMNVVSNPKAESTVSPFMKLMLCKNSASHFVPHLLSLPHECSWLPPYRAAVHTALLYVIAKYWHAAHRLWVELAAADKPCTYLMGHSSVSL